MPIYKYDGTGRLRIQSSPTFRLVITADSALEINDDGSFLYPL